jgi:ComF family protein
LKIKLKFCCGREATIKQHGHPTNEDKRMTELASRVGSALANIASGALKLLYPPRCAYCHVDLPEPEDHLPLCSACCRRLVPEKWIGCRRCGGAIPEESPTSDRCSRCGNPRLMFDRVETLGGYHTTLREVILLMKHARHEPLAIAMGRLLAEKRFRELADLRAEMVVPIPMYWSRRLRRGTNSPEVLARCLAEKLGIPVERRLLFRSRDTLPQSGLPPRQRFRNVRGAFSINTRRRLQGARVLLVDDVLTTGATSGEAAGVLKQAGASLVAVAVVARAQGIE